MEALLVDPQYRNGVPQQYFSHGVLSYFVIAAEKLFPGLEKFYISKGALPLDFGEIKAYFFVGYVHSLQFLSSNVYD